MKNLLFIILTILPLSAYEIIVDKTTPMPLASSKKNLNVKEEATEYIKSFLYEIKDGYCDTVHLTGKSDPRCKKAKDIKNFDEVITTLLLDEQNNIEQMPTKIELIKDEFETSEEFDLRVQETTLKYSKQVDEYYQKVETQKQNIVKKALEITWGKPIITNLKYDADNSFFVADVTFEVQKDFNKRVILKIEREEAKAFKNSVNKVRVEGVFEYKDSSVFLKDIRVPFKGQNYSMVFADVDLKETTALIHLENFKKQFDGNIEIGSQQMKHLDANAINNYNELNNLLEKVDEVQKDYQKWLFVVGIEKYEYTDNISYAKRSAEMFVETIQKKLGTVKQNSYIMINEDATQAKIKQNLKKMLRKVKEGDTIYFYYNGHGLPVPNLQNEPYMLTFDTEPDFVADEKFFSLQNIYAKLSDSKASKIVAFVDSCFSGVTDAKAVLKGVAATKMVAKSVKFDKNKMVVISAGKSHQFSNGFDKKGHRLFSFYVMKNIIEGDTDIKQLYKSIKEQTYDTSIEEYGDLRIQEPTIEGNYRMSL
ncbi:MAG: caspase family protein [Thiovulaceae bacterium]|nr:caspase family protein [Sulfurimonadaceae bacterium]